MLGVDFSSSGQRRLRRYHSSEGLIKGGGKADGHFKKIAFQAKRKQQMQIP